MANARLMDAAMYRRIIFPCEYPERVLEVHEQATPFDQFDEGTLIEVDISGCGYRAVVASDVRIDERESWLIAHPFERIVKFGDCKRVDLLQIEKQNETTQRQKDVEAICHLLNKGCLPLPFKPTDLDRVIRLSIELGSDFSDYRRYRAAFNERHWIYQRKRECEFALRNLRSGLLEVVMTKHDHW